MTSSVILIRGLPGSGKSTLAKQLIFGRPKANHFEADDYFVDFYTDKYRFDATKIKEAHNYCQIRFKQALERVSELIVVSNTFTKKWELQFYLDQCELHGIRPQIITCEGKFENIHGVPKDKIAQMRARWEPL